MQYITRSAQSETYCSCELLPINPIYVVYNIYELEKNDTKSVGRSVCGVELGRLLQILENPRLQRQLFTDVHTIFELLILYLLELPTFLLIYYYDTTLRGYIVSF